MKQWMSLLLALVLLFTCFPLDAVAADEYLEQPAVKLSNIAEGISIEWDAVEGAEAYQVFRKTSDSWVLLAEVTEPGYQDDTAEDGVTYYYSVVAKCGDTLSSGEQYAQISRLASPEVTVKNFYNGVSVQWTAVEGAESYDLYRKVPGGSWEVLKTGRTGLSYTDKTVKETAEYVYAVRAMNATGGSAYASSGQIIRILQPEATVSNEAEGVLVTWYEVDSADCYNVYRKISGGSWKRLGTETGTAYLDTTAENGVEYFYRVRSKSGDVLSSDKHSVGIVRLGQTAVTLRNYADGISVKWEAVEGAESYQIYRKTGDGSWELIKSGRTSLSYTDKTVEYGKTYSYCVRACKNGSLGGDQLSTAILRIEQPVAEVANKYDGVQITWNKVESAECYNVYRKLPGGSWKRISTEMGTSYKDTDVRSGETYLYRVRAKNGDTLSSDKHSVSILRLDRPIPTASNGNKGVIIKWEAIEGAQSYRVQRKVPGGSWKTLASDFTELKYTDTTAKSGKTYLYTVRAYGDGVISGNLATKELQYLSRPVASAKTVSATSVKIQWNAVEGAEKYIVSVKNDDGEWKSLKTVTGTEYTAGKLTFGETYSFGVRAVGESGRSTRSASTSAKATYPAPDYSLELKPGQGIEISWSAIEGAGSYRVYRRTAGGSWKFLKTTTATSYVDSSGQPGVTYEYGVRAFELANAEGIYGIRAAGKTIVYSMIDPSKPMVALTFDDGPSAYTRDILDQLEKYDAHATFFVVGNRVASNASTIKRAYDMGCEIGNHSWSHPQLSAISVTEMKNELNKTDEAVRKITGETPALLRPPYGAVDADVKAYAGKPLIHWSIDTLDWSHRTASKTISSVLNNVRDGSIVLMHDIYAPTRDAAVSLIPTLISRGYQLVTVSEMAAYRGVNLQDGTIYYSIR